MCTKYCTVHVAYHTQYTLHINHAEEVVSTGIKSSKLYIYIFADTKMAPNLERIYELGSTLAGIKDKSTYSQVLLASSGLQSSFNTLINTYIRSCIVEICLYQSVFVYSSLFDIFPIPISNILVDDRDERCQ